jgi:hypothetical protein
MGISVVTRTAALVVLGLVLASCKHTEEALGVSGGTFCQIAPGPIYWSKTDTRETIRQADVYNRIGRRLCRWGRRK